MMNLRINIAFLIVMIVSVVSSCSSDNRSLLEVEILLESNAEKADSILQFMNSPLSNRERAWYAVLKTQTDYQLNKPIKNDSLILTATNYYGSHRKSYRSAMAWYSQGCVYSKMRNDMAAIYAYLKAKDLFPDTLVRYYALTEKNLGNHYLNKKMYEQAIFEFNNCKINANRLFDTITSYYATAKLWSCAFEKGVDYSSDSLFSLLNDDFMDDTLVNVPLYVKDKSELSGIDGDTLYETVVFRRFSWNNNLSNDSVSLNQYNALKAALFYYKEDYDSAFFYYKKAINNMNILSLLNSYARKLTEISIRIGNTEEALHWYNYYVELCDSINSVEKSDSREILDLQYLHREELREEMMQNRYKRFLIIGFSSIVLITLLILLVYALFKNREKKRIIRKQEELLSLEKEIRTSSIAILESQVRNQSHNNPEARTALLNLYSHRLNLNKEYFQKTIEYKKLISASAGLDMTMQDKEKVLVALNQSFNDSLVDIQIEYPGIDTEESLTLILSSLHFKNEFISWLFGNVTPEAIRKRKYRLSKANPDFFSQFIN